MVCFASFCASIASWLVAIVYMGFLTRRALYGSQKPGVRFFVILAVTIAGADALCVLLYFSENGVEMMGADDDTTWTWLCLTTWFDVFILVTLIATCINSPSAIGSNDTGKLDNIGASCQPGGLMGVAVGKGVYVRVDKNKGGALPALPALPALIR